MLLSRFEAGFWQHVEAAPESMAIDLGEEHYTYQQLAQFASAIAACLMENYPSKGQRIIGIWAEKDLTAYSAALGILSANHVYAPLGVKFPVARLQVIMAQAQMQTIIVGEAMLPQLPELLQGLEPMHIISLCDISDAIRSQCAPHRLTVLHAETPATAAASLYAPPHVQPDDMAYLLFTSGSTGVPKGVPISHRNACAYLHNLFALIPLTHEDRFSQTFPFTFDLSVHDLFVCMSVGACLCPIPAGKMMAPTQYINEKGITVWFSVPSQAASMKQFRQLQPNQLPTLKHSLFAGEALPTDIVMDWSKAAPSSRIYNLYGLTETTIATTFYDCTPEAGKTLKERNGVISVGKVFADQFIRLDAPAGSTEGELWFAGSQIIERYFNNEAANAQKFTRDEQLWYKTGDLFYQDEDGDLYFVSRLDHQVKLHGYRIELEEINTAVRQVSGHSHVCTLLAGSGSQSHLVAFIAGSPSIDSAALNAALATILPVYMLPKQVRFIDAMPLNDSGKIDRKALLSLLTA